MQRVKRCIFCKQDSSTSRSAEHILPEALGNEEHTLPPGIVCDGCNNYFASSIEQSVLESGHFTSARFNARIPNKKNRVSLIPGMLLPLQPRKDRQFYTAEVSRTLDGDFELYPTESAKEGILSGAFNRLIVPASGAPPRCHVFARFLAKVALESLAQQLLHYEPGSIDECIDNKQLDLLRNYARYGRKGLDWPYSERQIYPPDFIFSEGQGAPAYEVLHEWTFLYTPAMELYFVVAIFGHEYAINAGGPDIDGYATWLQQNNGKSPLYL